MSTVRPAPVRITPTRVPTTRLATGRLATRIGSALAVVAIAAFVGGPLLWLFAHAFADSWQPPALLPDGVTLRWWASVLNDPSLSVAIRNSAMFAVLSTLASAVICLPAAHAFGRAQFPGRNLLLLGLFATNAFPKMGLFVALATIYYAFGLMNTIVGVTIAHMLGQVIFLTWIPAAAFASVPRNLEEAARDAGAGPVRTFLTVTLRMAAPGILVGVILAFLASWDESQATYLVGAPVFETMPTKLYSLVLNSPRQVAAVFSILLTIPSVGLLLLVRRHVMGGQLAEGFQLK